ncbi:Retinoblastoma-related protein 1 [Camellia lanceoleosa]|uniref:Retinoblastoma-related protein 1 n=1 Tax=Camellia lanceoleosa TaxID=1840588 RepID=A0ACC0GWY3_9ERIC|nr:Retinoblastoma-related protein 1 [Camellia lanceoleosa]
MFFNHHIDQIILYCFHVVPKISQLRLTFKEIIFNYRKQPQCKPQAFRSVFVDWSSARRHGLCTLRSEGIASNSLGFGI